MSMPFQVAPVMVLADTVASILLLSRVAMPMPEFAERLGPDGPTAIRFPLMVTARHWLTPVPTPIPTAVEVATITLSEIVTLEFTGHVEERPETKIPGSAKLTILNPETVAVLE